MALSKQPRYLTDAEKRFINWWVNGEDLAVTEAARRRRHSESTVWDALADSNNARCGVGRKASLDESS